MRRIFVLFFVLFSFLSFAQVKWMSFSDALNAQKVQPKKIMINFYADWCKPCKEMDQTTYTDPLIVNYINEKFYAVKFEADGNEKISYLGKNFGKNTTNKKKQALNNFTLFMNVSSIPSTVFLDEHSLPITNINGYLTAKELGVYLSMIASNDYKKIKSRTDWEEYNKKLQSKTK